MNNSTKRTLYEIMIIISKRNIKISNATKNRSKHFTHLKLNSKRNNETTNFKPTRKNENLKVIPSDCHF